MAGCSLAWDTQPVSRQKCPFLSVFQKQINNRKPVVVAGVPGMFLSLLCALFFPDLPSKNGLHINSQNYFYATYVMHYMIITYFDSLKIFICKSALY